MSQAGFGRRIGIDPSNLSKSLSGRAPLGESLINRLVAELGVSKRWLVDGIGSPMENNASGGAPVYDIDITAGSLELSRTFTDDRVIGYISLPEVTPGCPVVRVSGDSMTPVVNDGSLVAVRQVDPAGTIYWGQIYVVVLDDYRMVKFVRPNHSDSNRIILHSANAAYDDIDISRDDIRALFIVETVINVDRRC